MLEAFRLVAAEDNKQAGQQQQQQQLLRQPTFTSPDVFIKQFPTTAPLFSKQVGLRFEVAAQFMPDKSSASAPTLSLADQIRADIKKEQEERKQQPKEEEQEEQKSSSEAASAVPAAAPTPSPASADMMQRRVCGYAPRGRRGRYGVPAPSATQQQQQQQQEEEEEDTTTSKPQVYEIFPPQLREDLNKTIAVDARMPVRSERAFRSLLTCAFTALLLRDRPSGGDPIDQQQELAEKAIAQGCVKAAWAAQQRWGSGIEEDYEAIVTEQEVRDVLPHFLSGDVDALVQAVFNTYLAPLRFLLPPVVTFFAVAPAPAAADKSTASSSSSSPHHQCSCAQIEGTLENIKWQLIRRTIDYRGDAVSALRRVLMHWDPAVRLKRQFAAVFEEWSSAGIGITEEKLADVVAAPGSVKLQPLSLMVATRLLEQDAAALQKRDAEIAQRSKSGGAGGSKFVDANDQSSSVLKNDDVDESSAAETINARAATRVMAQDLLVFKRLSCLQGLGDDGSVALSAAGSLKVHDLKSAVLAMMRWWTVLLREQCPVCSTKVF